MKWLETLRAFDHWLFMKINGDWSHPWMDGFFVYMTDLFKQPSFKFVIFPALLIYHVYKYKWVAVKIVLGTLLVFAVSDNITHRVYKKTIERKRPEFVLEKVNLRTHSHSGYSFPSNHATNSFAIFVFLSFFMRYRFLLIFAACLVAYSRVYVGVHFPVDVAAGALSGTLIAYAGYGVYRYFRAKRLLPPSKAAL